MTNIISVHGLTYEYEKDIRILDNINFYLSENDNLALIGANGVGKSTFLQLILGLLEPKSGEIFYKGSKITKKSLPDIRKNIGFIFQNPDVQLFCNTIFDDIAFGPLNAGLPAAEVQARAEEVLKALNISHLKERTPFKLSAGEKRLSAIATVLSMQPKVLLMDEPSAELDPKARRNLIALINSLPQAKIIATHDLDLAKKTCKRALVLHNGKADMLDEIPDENSLIEYGL